MKHLQPYIYLCLFLGTSLPACINWQRAQDQFCAGSLNPNCSSLLQESVSARPIWPLSTGFVTSRTPTFQWVLPPGAEDPIVELCTSRDCSHVTTTIAPDETGLKAKPNQMLPSGWIWWRVRTSNKAGSSYSPVWQFFVGAASAGVDTSYGSALDLNGDGRSEVAVGAYCVPYNGTSCGEGRVYVYSGAATEFGSGKPITLKGETVGSSFGLSTASAGDVNGDGYADLIVGAPNANSFGAPGVGRVYIYLGGPNGLTDEPIIVDSPDGSSGRFGYSVAGAGDIDHDGYADVIVGAPGANRVHIYRGGPSKLSEMAPLDSPDGQASFGSAVASAGDVDGNAYSDVLVGAPSKNDGVYGGGGAFYVYFGSKDGLVRTHRNDDSSYFNGWNDYGSTVAGNGDVNGDGLGDILVGCNTCADGTDATHAVMLGYTNWYAGFPGQSFDFVIPHSLPGPPTGTAAHYGVSVALGDVDGDGFSDAVVGSEYEGEARFFGGGLAGLSSTPIRLAPAGVKPGYGQAVAMTDIDGDGHAEIFVGLPSTSEVYVYRGPITGPSPKPLAVLSCPDGPDPTTGYGKAISGR